MKITPDDRLHLVRCFNKASAIYKKSLPHTLKNLLIVTTVGPIYVAPEIAAEVSKEPGKVQALVNKRAADMRRAKTTGYAGPDFLGKQPIQLISLNLDAERQLTVVSDRFSPLMNAAYLYDHEMAHLIIPEGMPINSSQHMAECVADAYATMRHIQRFGTKTDILQCGAANMAAQAFLESPCIHYTSAVMQKIADLQEQGNNIENMSLKETGALALQIATEYQLNIDTINKISTAYAPVRAIFHVYDDAQSLKEIIKVMLAHPNDPDIYRVGKVYMNHPRQKKKIEALISTDDTGHAQDPELYQACHELQRLEKKTRFCLSAVASMDAARYAAGKGPSRCLR